MLRKGLTLTLFVISFVSVVAQTKNLHVFPDSIKKQFPVEVYDFIERYIAECLSWNDAYYPLSRRLSDDKVYFYDGDITSLHTLPETYQFTLTRYDDKNYEAIWTSDAVILRMVFPVQYELLLGKGKKELEQELEDAIINARDIGSVCEQELEPMTDSLIYFSVPIQNYQVPELTNTSYYTLQDGDFCVILDTAYNEYSLRNILLVPSEYNPIIKVEQRMYGLERKVYTITMGQWLAYCYQENMSLFVAIKDKSIDSYEVVLVAENKDLAYNHLLTISVPRNFLTNNYSVWTSQLRGYIPTHNVKNMYKQYEK